MEIVAIAHSGRAIAASSARAQQPIHIIDCYADTDTAKFAMTVQRVSALEYGFHQDELFHAVTSLLNDYEAITIVPCSGFESDPETLMMLMSLAPCLGNSVDTIQQCKDPGPFFQLLTKSAIRYPKICRELKNETHVWLIKRIGAMGGDHIHRYKKQIAYDSDMQYLQQFIPGQSMSVVFVADGQRQTILGFNDLILLECSDSSPFAFAGAITVPLIDNAIKDYLITSLDKLVPELGLFGLCGADFIVNEQGKVYLLEINPRPTATFELHEQGRSFFEWHLQACQGQLPVSQSDTFGNQYKAMLNIYSSNEMKIDKAICWPDWTANRPAAGQRIKRAGPVCTIYAQADNREKTLNLLYDRQYLIAELLHLH